jgi:hypothetical protein
VLGPSPRLVNFAAESPQGAQLRIWSPAGLVAAVMIDLAANGISAVYVLTDPRKLAQITVH